MRKFWSTVGVIELTDIAFAVDSILAAIALVGAAPTGHTGFHPKLWVVITGGMLGVILMRFAAVIFIKLLDKFPRFETAAYLLVAVIGGKLLVDWHFNVPGQAHSRVDFHSPVQPCLLGLLDPDAALLPGRLPAPEKAAPASLSAVPTARPMGAMLLAACEVDKPSAVGGCLQQS